MNHPFIPLLSRSHPLYGFANSPCCYIKREDELSAGVSGSKCRKYGSLLPYLLLHQFQQVFLIGSTHSNNVLSAVQLLKENQIQCQAVLLKARDPNASGNFKLSRLFLEPEHIHWIDREQWSDVENFTSQLAEQSPLKSYVLPEGGFVTPAITGAQTLADDIVLNEKELNLGLDNIFIDSATGLSALGWIQRLKQLNHPATRYVILLADKPDYFQKKAREQFDLSSNDYQILTPKNARAFGSVNRTVKDYIQTFAFKHGVLLDPIYSAKLFYEAEAYIKQHALTGNILCIHSGGLLSLPNFV